MSVSGLDGVVDVIGGAPFESLGACHLTAGKSRRLLDKRGVFMTRIHRPQRRAAFTLVEMMVASALIIFMMWIIATAFEKGLTSFRVLKTAGDMQEKLRAATTAIRRDLTRPHFGDPVSTDAAATNENLSDQRLDQDGWEPPDRGYFRIFTEGQLQLQNFDGPDSEDTSLLHYHFPDAAVSRGHVLQFTTRLRGNRRDQSFLIDTRDGNATTDGPLHALSFPIYSRRQIRNTAPATTGAGTIANPIEPRPPLDPQSSMFTTTWAEITYFLRYNGSDIGGVPLYTLYRRQNLLVTDDGNLPAPLPVASPTSSVNNGEYLQVSSWPNSMPTPYQVNTQKSVTAPIRRFGVQNNNLAGDFLPLIPRIEDQAPALNNPSHPLTGGDILLTDVTNFTVKVLWDSPTTATIAQLAANPDFPFDYLPPIAGTNPAWSGRRVFDTWSKYESTAGALDDYRDWDTPGTQKSIPIKIRVRAIQIELRIWDVKSQQSRQITIIQDV